MQQTYSYIFGNLEKMHLEWLHHKENEISKEKKNKSKFGRNLTFKIEIFNETAVHSYAFNYWRQFFLSVTLNSYP